MNGITDFISNVVKMEEFGATVLCLGLVIAFLLSAIGISMLDGPFMIAIAIILIMASIVSLVYFFIALYSLLEEATYK